MSKRAKPKAAQLSQTRTQESASASKATSAAAREVSALKNQFEQITQRKAAELTNHGAFTKFFAPVANMDSALSELERDLADVPVVDDNGTVTNPFSKISECSYLSDNDKRLIWHCMCVVREAFYRADESIAAGKSGGYQWNMNWKHTRAEVDQVLEASRLLMLDQQSTAEALLASIFSDSVKNRRNFITHNIDGAYGAAEVLFQFLNPASAADVSRVERIAQAVREHQIAPPEFMARATSIMLCQKLKVPRFDARTYTAEQHTSQDAHRGMRSTISSIYRKISEPFDKQHLSPDLHRIAFTDEERNILKEIGIEDWYVPHPDNADARTAHAVIAGDHSINYNHPEGFAKIALIRGPDTEAIFEDPTVLDSLYSAVNSFTDSFRVLLPEVQPMAIAGLRRTQLAVERVTAIMRELFSGVVVGPHERSVTGFAKIEKAIERAHERHPELFTVDTNDVFSACEKNCERAIYRVSEILQQWLDEYGEIPFNQKNSMAAEPGAAKLPFWNAPLLYPERDSNGSLNVSSLNELQQKQFYFAARIRDIAVELLRAEQWIY